MYGLLQMVTGMIFPIKLNRILTALTRCSGCITRWIRYLRICTVQDRFAGRFVSSAKVLNAGRLCEQNEQKVVLSQK